LRVLVPEILDGLAPDDPRAIRSRRDLVRINAVMRQPAIMARYLSRLDCPKVLADLGGGDGRFLLAVAKRLARRWPGVTALVCDQADIVSPQTRAAFLALGWRCETRVGDVFDTLPDADIVMANLFLHHFDNARLMRLLALAADHTRAFVACEPRRSRFGVIGARLVGLLGANDVTRHDAVASVRAGFRDLELASLWPGDIPQRRWQLTETSAFPFSHVFVAQAL